MGIVEFGDIGKQSVPEDPFCLWPITLIMEAGHSHNLLAQKHVISDTHDSLGIACWIFGLQRVKDIPVS